MINKFTSVIVLFASFFLFIDLTFWNTHVGQGHDLSQRMRMGPKNCIGPTSWNNHKKGTWILKFGLVLGSLALVEGKRKLLFTFY